MYPQVKVENMSEESAGEGETSQVELKCSACLSGCLAVVAFIIVVVVLNVVAVVSVVVVCCFCELQ